MKLLIIQTGDALGRARSYGNFDDWFKQAVPEVPAKTVHVHQGEILPEIEVAKAEFSHIIITGSGAMVTEQNSWMLKTQRWLAAVIEDVPTLGVCFGHQLLADLLGGRVDYNPKGRNMGLDVCQLTNSALKDPLFNHEAQSSFNTWASHSQAVLELPKSCHVLGQSPKDTHHVFRYQKHVYGVQFHPEWDAKIMQAYLLERQPQLLEEGFGVKKMLEATSETVNGMALIQQFVRTILV